MVFTTTAVGSSHGSSPKSQPLRRCSTPRPEGKRLRSQANADLSALKSDRLLVYRRFAGHRQARLNSSMRRDVTNVVIREELSSGTS